MHCGLEGRQKKTFPILYTHRSSKVVTVYIHQESPNVISTDNSFQYFTIPVVHSTVYCTFPAAAMNIRASTIMQQPEQKVVCKPSATNTFLFLIYH